MALPVLVQKLPASTNRQPRTLAQITIDGDRDNVAHKVLVDEAGHRISVYLTELESPNQVGCAVCGTLRNVLSVEDPIDGLDEEPGLDPDSPYTQVLVPTKEEYMARNVPMRDLSDPDPENQPIVALDVPTSPTLEEGLDLPAAEDEVSQADLARMNKSELVDQFVKMGGQRDLGEAMTKAQLVEAINEFRKPAMLKTTPLACERKAT
jgi:hypothetical protein